MSSLFSRTLVATAFVASSFALAGSASATIVYSLTDYDFGGRSTTFGYLGQSFTMSDNGTGFPSPVSASTSGTAMYAKDFAGISVFFDPPRNNLVFDDGLQYASYPSATPLAFSALPTIVGLAVTAADGVHYGYAELSGTLLESYAFESQPGVGIAALAPIVTAIPEPAGFALLAVGGLALLINRRRKHAAA